MKPSRKTIFSAALMLTLAACAGSPAWQSLKMSSTAGAAKANNSKIMSLQLGQTRGAVIEMMGEPEKREAYQTKSGEIEFLFYRTEAWDGRAALSSDDQFTPIAFSSGILQGWGQNFYAQTVRIAITSD